MNHKFIKIFQSEIFYLNMCNVKEVQSFLGFTNFYCRFIEDYSKIVIPLTQLTCKDTPFIWDDKCQSVFETLKETFTTAPVLAHNDPMLPCILETDSSGDTLGAVLSQVHEPDSILHPVAFHSCTLSSAEQNYEIYNKELNAIIDSFKHWC